MKTIKIIILLIVTTSLAFFIKTTDFQQVLPTLIKFRFEFIYLVLITFIAYLFATIGWKYSLGWPAEKIRVTDLFLIRHLGEMFSIINPVSIIGGEALKIYLLEEKGLKRTTVLASILTSRILMAATQLLLFLITLPVVVFEEQKLRDKHFNLVLFWPGLLILAFVLLTGFLSRVLLKRHVTHIATGKFVAFLASKLKISQVLTEFRLFFETDKKGLILCILFYLAHWICGSLEIYVILKFLGIDVSVVHIVFMDMGIIVFKAAGAFVPGQIGVEELANKIMLELIGIPGSDIWLTITVLRRSRQLFWILFALGAYLLFYKKIKAVSEP